MRQRQPEAWGGFLDLGSNGSRLCRKRAGVQDHRSWSGLLGKGSINNGGGGGAARNSLCRWSAQLEVEERGPGRVMYCALCPPVSRLSLKREPPRRAHLCSSTDSQIRASLLAFIHKE
jgi:hypothetical protein